MDETSLLLPVVLGSPVVLTATCKLGGAHLDICAVLAKTNFCLPDKMESCVLAVCFETAASLDGLPTCDVIFFEKKSRGAAMKFADLLDGLHTCSMDFL